MSLRSRLLALGAGAAAAVLVLLAVPVTLVLVGEAHGRAEGDAATLVQGVADYLSTGSATVEDLTSIVEQGRGRRGDDAGVVVVLSDGTVVGDDSHGCRTAASDSTRAPSDDRQGSLGTKRTVSEVSRSSVDGGVLVSVDAEGTPGPIAVCTFVSDADVNQQVARRLGPLAAAAVVVLLAVTGTALLLARRLTRHLEDAAGTADRIAAGDLEARVAPAGPPEVRRVGNALNRLVGRIGELLASERETVADLSHRLRTPLTAVRLDVDALPDSPAKRELDDDVALLERTLTGVIKAARKPEREGTAPACDVVAVTRERFDYWSPLLEDQGRPNSLVVNVGSGVGPVRCARDDLAAALDALLENAIAHTGDGIAVSVEVSHRSIDGTLVRVDVRDGGPGVALVALERGRSDRGSSGLGLDIARSCAEGSGGRLELDRDADGSVVRLLLGPA